MENLNSNEADLIGNFVLRLYLQKLISAKDGWIILKNRARLEFSQYLKERNIDPALRKTVAATNIGTLLKRNQYLIDTPLESKNYQIKHVIFSQFYLKKLKEFDEKRKNYQIKPQPLINFKENDENGKSPEYCTNNPELAAAFQVDDSSISHTLKYQGTLVQDRDEEFFLTNIGCYICQLNFGSQSLYEEHVEYHGDSTDFQSSSKYENRITPFFHLTYRVCKNSHYFCFTLNILNFDCENITIDKIIVVQSRLMSYVHHMSVPFIVNKSNEKGTFFIDSNWFQKYLEQPIVIVFNVKNVEKKRFVEQHHFMRVEDFPQVNFAISPFSLPSSLKFKAVLEIPHYYPTNEVRKAIEGDSLIESLSLISNGFTNFIANDKNFTPSNIRNVFDILLQLEDIEVLRDYENLIQHKALLSVFGNQCSVKVSTTKCLNVEDVICPIDIVLIIPDDKMGDHKQIEKKSITDLYVKYAKESKIATGKVSSVRGGRVYFESRNKLASNIFYTILFYPQRFVMRYQYRGLELLSKFSPNDIESMLFPKNLRKMNLPVMNLQLFNEQISENPEQLQTVKNIAHGPRNDAPYIIFGPPGTGKTSTIVESILQLFKLRPHTKILVTAGSNSACDEVALRLCKILSLEDNPRAIVRIYSRSHESHSENISEILLDRSNMYKEHFFPDVNIVHLYRIVVCTLSMVGKLATGKFGQNVFTHVFIDEAGASTQPETYMGLIPVLSKTLCVILAGDHKQLGPVIHSKHATDLGLGVSLMERLLERDCYSVDENGDYDRTIQTRLCRNYRSHPQIVDLYNKLYYNNELKALAPENVTLLAKNWHRSQNPDFPIMFHSVFRQCFREIDSYSLCNFKEVEVVMEYVRDLMYFGINGLKIEQEDIGIISPYKKQYRLIHNELNLRNWNKIETGSVETFQGKEKTVIIVSFVRSFTSSLGFLDSPRRLNVTLSRPKSMLILIGNPKTLNLNVDFKKIIDVCRINGTLVGDKYHENFEPRNLDRIGIITNSMDRLQITNKDKSQTNKSANSTSENDNQSNNVGREKQIDEIFANLPKLHEDNFTMELKEKLSTKIGMAIAKNPSPISSPSTTPSVLQNLKTQTFYSSSSTNNEMNLYKNKIIENSINLTASETSKKLYELSPVSRATPTAVADSVLCNTTSTDKNLYYLQKTATTSNLNVSHKTVDAIEKSKIERKTTAQAFGETAGTKYIFFSHSLQAGRTNSNSQAVHQAVATNGQSQISLEKPGSYIKTVKVVQESAVKTCNLQQPVQVSLQRANNTLFIGPTASSKPRVSTPTPQIQHMKINHFNEFKSRSPQQYRISEPVIHLAHEVDWNRPSSSYQSTLYRDQKSKKNCTIL